MPVPRLAVEPRGPQRLHPVPGPPQPRPPDPDLSGGRAQRVGVHLARHRGARARTSTCPTSSPSFGDGSSAADYYPQQRRCTEQGLELHPQYVLENGVDFAHFKFVHNTPIVPVFTRHDFDEPMSYVDFTITFEGDDGQTIDDIKSGVEAINGGLGIAVTKSWGMVDNRTISAITPVDESHLRRALHGLHRPHARRRLAERAETKAHEFGARGHRPVQPGHPHLVTPALLGSARAGQRRVRGVHRDPQVGHAVLSRRPRRQRRRTAAVEPASRMDRISKPIRVFQVATGNVGTEMIKRIATAPTSNSSDVHCYTPEKIGRDAGELAGLAPDRRDGDRHRSTRSSPPSPTC